MRFLGSFNGLFCENHYRRINFYRDITMCSLELFNIVLYLLLTNGLFLISEDYETFFIYHDVDCLFIGM